MPISGLYQTAKAALTKWQGQKDSNPRHAVLETAALPAELYPYICTLILQRQLPFVPRRSAPHPVGGLVGLQGLEPGTNRL